MTLQSIIALYAGLTYLAAGAAAIPILKVLGPLYPTRMTAPDHYLVMGMIWMVVEFIRAVTILFPGQVVTLSAISLVSPIKATTDLMLTLFLLDVVLRWRAPPPLIARLLAIAGANGVSDRGLTEMAFVTPASVIADDPASEAASHPQIGRKWVRVAMLTGAAVLIALILAMVVMNSAAAAGA